MRCALRGSLGTVRQASLFAGCGSTGREFAECKIEDLLKEPARLVLPEKTLRQKS